LFEIDGVNEATAREAFRLAANKLSFRCRFVARNREVKV
jgi:large subunit ribosomal protein L16